MSISGPHGSRHAIGQVARPAKDATPQEKLRATAQQLQGVFVEQLFKAMRATVPEDGVFSGGQGEEMFRGLLDQRMSESVPEKWTGPHSLGEVIVRQLSLALPATPQTAAPLPEDR
ncbi:MAG: rod-binding protein [bacterium]